MMIKANKKLVYSMEGLKGLPLLSSHFLQAIEKNAFRKEDIHLVSNNLSPCRYQESDLDFKVIFF